MFQCLGCQEAPTRADHPIVPEAVDILRRGDCDRSGTQDRQVVA